MTHSSNHESGDRAPAVDTFKAELMYDAARAAGNLHKTLEENGLVSRAQL